ncbi:lipase/acyltransferase domain-containing protein [Bradyrhizobium sp. Pa8]|uniref:lipase/acyltransferase domain-containing protein n=1 Tax=Bradyrhizobium sp. Pa8 TaxID=3386552 RepID=UPI00403F79E9
MSDLIVLIPGLMGSVLVKDGKEIWAASGRTALKNLFHLKGSVTELKLPKGLGAGDPKDGVTAPYVLPQLAVLPTFWKADGYGRWAAFIRERFTITIATPTQAGNFLEFPYDWRLSSEHNATRLAELVVPALERWRKLSQNNGAKLILIGHSMGGLIARHFCEVLGGRDLTRKLITVGTPYGGSINALETLVNGLSFKALGLSLGELVRSFPSVYELLPTYKCLDVGQGELAELDKIATDLLPEQLDRGNLAQAFKFHERINNSVEANPTFQTFAIKGIDQPTKQSALLRNGKIESSLHHKGTDYGGDGTVPRPCAHPPEWGNDDGAAIFASQSHALLQSTDSILKQLFGMMSDQLGGFMGVESGLGLGVPETVDAGMPFLVNVRSVGGDAGLALQVTAHDEEGAETSPPKLMKTLGDGTYSVTLDGLAPGAHRITVGSASPLVPLDPVADWTLAWATVGAPP